MNKQSGPTIESLDHFFVYSSDLRSTHQFYTEILGLEDGPRPKFEFPGHWFYLDGKPVVHVGTEEFEGGYNNPGAQKTKDEKLGTGVVDHIAFKCRNADAFTKRLKSNNHPYKTQEIPDFDLRQIFVKDPDGVTIELNFFGE